jgi:class 3 adenylate cyclase
VGGTPDAAPAASTATRPSAAPGGAMMRAIGYASRRSTGGSASGARAGAQAPRGAEFDLSVMFADGRGSTASPSAWSPRTSPALSRFYGAAANVINDHEAIVDKFVGDSAIALFLPGFAGEDHPADAIAAARDLLEKTSSGGSEPWIPLGIGVHSGRSFVGAVGEGDPGRAGNRGLTPMSISRSLVRQAGSR